MTAHSQHSPSSAHRWIACPGSIQAEEFYPDTTSEYAEEGTCAHTVAQLCLDEDKPASAFIGRVFNGIEVDEDMAEAVQVYVDYCEGIRGDVAQVETKVDLTFITKDCFGTADFTSVHFDEKALDVVDLKFGKGVMVSAENNKQLGLYGLGQLHALDHLSDFDKVRLHIVQPRLHHIDVWETTPEALHKLEAEAKHAARLSLSDDAPRVPGDEQCRWCKAKADCQELADYVYDRTVAEFDDLEAAIENVPELDTERLAHSLKDLDLIRDWCNAIAEKAMEVLLHGETVEGYKLVEGRSSRKWSDEADAEKTFKRLKFKLDDFKPRSLLSVAQAEKVVGKKRFTEKFQEIVVKTPGKPTLAKASDRRKAIDPIARQGFDDLTETDDA